jgi:DNA helicase-2/ATP-dependent DNA helicase PcrA
MFDRLGEAVHEPVEQIVGLVLSETGYREVLENSESEEEEERLANIEELLTAAREFDIRNPGTGNLEQFLEESSLVADTDAWEGETDRVTLMTLHAAKGLEFPVVFIVACEEGLLPHDRSRHDDEKLEEERRLLFVGITRARQELQLSYAQYRTFRGLSSPTVASSFLMELPRHEMELSDTVTSRRTTPDWEEGFEPGAHDEFEADALQIGDEADTNPKRKRGTVPPEDDNYSQIDDGPAKRGEKAPATLTSGLVTAADLLAKNNRPRISPNVFKHGMAVEHPEYGAGTVIALSGDGPKRTATVRFFADSAERKFRLLFSDLTPAE